MSNKIKEYYDNLKLTQKEINNNYIVDGIEYPKDTKTDHQRFELFSDNHINYMTKLFNLFEVFHNWLEDNNILYTLYGGNLIGYYWNEKQILWDDDFDIFLTNNKGIEFINNIWNNSNEIAKLIWDECWIYKKITINEHNYLLLKYKLKNINWGWFKLLYYENINKNNKNNKDLGGIDIIFSINNIINNVDLTSINNLLLNIKNYENVNFGPITVKVLNKDIAYKLNNATYGSKWIIKKHPSLKN